MSCSCWMTIDGPYQLLGHLLHPEWGANGVITSVAADVGDRWVHVFSKTSWGILDQLDTRGLFSGDSRPWGPRCGATGAFRCSDCVMHLCIDCCGDNCLFLLLMCWLMLKPIPLFWDLYCYGNWPGSLVARECFMYYKVGIVITWKLYDWYGLIHFTFLLLVFL